MRLRLIVTALLWLAGATAYGDWQAMGDYRIAAYCPCAACCGKSDGITADGTPLVVCP